MKTYELLSRPCSFSTRLMSHPLLLVLLLVLVTSVHAQNIILKTGETIETRGVRRSGDMVMGKIQVGSSSGEVGYRVATITRIDFPDPPQLKTTAEFLSQGEPKKALADIDPVVKILRAISRSARQLVGAGRAARSRRPERNAARQGGRSAWRQDSQERDRPRDGARRPVAARPGTSTDGRLRQGAATLRRRDQGKRQTGCPGRGVGREGATRFLNQRQWDDAVLAYLHVPVFYADEKRWMPPALLGSARALRGLGDLEGAKRSFNDLTAKFPKSAQAEIARAELKKLPK